MIQFQIKTVYKPSDFLRLLSQATATTIKRVGYVSELQLSHPWVGSITTIELASGSLVEISSIVALHDIKTAVEFEFYEDWYVLSMYLREDGAVLTLEIIGSGSHPMNTLKKYEQVITNKVFYTCYEPQDFKNDKIVYYLNKKWFTEHVILSNQSNEPFKEKIGKINTRVVCTLDSKIYADINALLTAIVTLPIADIDLNSLNELPVLGINYLLGYEIEATSANREVHNIMVLANYLKYYDFQKPPPSLEGLTKFTGLNRNKLQKLFREQFGKTYYQFYQEARFRFAEELISNGGYNISEAARMVGFKHISHFSMYFEKVMGYKPSALKKKNS